MRIRDLLFGMTVNERLTDVGLLLLRVFTGLALALAHGWGKVPPPEGFIGRVGEMGMPAPEILAWVGALAEFGGGLLLALGLLTRPTSFLLVGHFVIVAFLAHAGDPFGRRELALFFLVVAVLYLLAGAGRYSVDAVLRGRTR